MMLFLLFEPIEQAMARIHAADPPAVQKGLPLTPRRLHASNQRPRSWAIDCAHFFHCQPSIHR